MCTRIPIGCAHPSHWRDHIKYCSWRFWISSVNFFLLESFVHWDAPGCLLFVRIHVQSLPQTYKLILAFQQGVSARSLPLLSCMPCHFVQANSSWRFAPRGTKSNQTPRILYPSLFVLKFRESTIATLISRYSSHSIQIWVLAILQLGGHGFPTDHKDSLTISGWWS